MLLYPRMAAAVLKLGVIVTVPLVVSSQRQINGVASPENTIHLEEIMSLDYSRQTIQVDSPVPVTVQRYIDTNNALEGQQAVSPDFGKVLVTSNCDTSQTQIIPTITQGDDGSIKVEFDGLDTAEASSMSFLDPSSYTALWSWISDFCNEFPMTPPPSLDVPVDEVQPGSSGGSSKCETGPMANSDNDCASTSEFCQLDIGACNNKSGIHYGYCLVVPEVCNTMYDPVCGCDEQDYSNECFAYSSGVSVSRRGTCAESTIDETEIPIESGGKCEVGPLADPDNDCPASTGEVCRLEMGECNTGGVHFGYCVVPDDICAEIYDPVCGCDEQDYDNACSAHAQGVSISRMGTCAESTIDETVTTSTGSPIDGCSEGECLNPKTGLCEVQVSCIADPCSVPGDYNCTDTEICTANYCGGCHALCVQTLPPPGVWTASTGGDTTAVVTDPTETVLTEGTCDVGASCSELGSVCTTGSESCCGETYPSFRCECIDPSGNGLLQYDNCLFTDSCMYPSCCMDGPPAGMPDPSAGTCSFMGASCDTGIEDDFCCFEDMGEISYCTKSGGKTIETSTTTTFTTTTTTTPVTEESGTEESMPVNTLSPTDSPLDEIATTEATSISATSDPTTVGSTTQAMVETSSPSNSPIDEITTTEATVETTETTSTSSATTSSSSFNAIIDGEFPTGSPTNVTVEFTSSPTASNWWQTDNDSDTDRSSAFHRSRSFCMATAFLAIVLIAVIFPGNAGGNNHLWGIGKFAVAAMAVSSLFPKRSSSKVGSIRKVQETCTFNVEVLLDGCTKSVEIINAPAGRVVDVVIENQTSQSNAADECQTDYEAQLIFPITEETEVLDLSVNNTAAALEEWDYQCLRAVVGRPFVDASGGSLQALPQVVDKAGLSWTVDPLVDQTVSRSMNNDTSHGRFLLGEEWIQRALGEHASIASFSAFSIALMTNGASSRLVEDALKAGIDEVLHAQMSFDIAARLTGKQVGPGKLPPSSHQFGHNLTALALAVAREGCVDETLSAFAAAIEVEHINEVGKGLKEDSVYSEVDDDTLIFIKDQLLVIAMDESNHSALAWRTIQWLCSVDSDACDAVNRDVFEESNLEMRFTQRADESFSETSSVLDLMRGEWMKIFNSYQLAQEKSVCKNADAVEVGDGNTGHPLLAAVTDIVIRQLGSC